MVADGDLNFRVRGIPNAYENKSGVRKLIMEVLSIQPGTSVSVRSLAASPIDANTRVATVVFHRLPAPLSDRDKDEWSFSLPVREDVDEDDIDWPLPIIFDTHFIGFTPLDHASQSESHVESVLEDSSSLIGHEADQTLQCYRHFRSWRSCIRIFQGSGWALYVAARCSPIGFPRLENPG